LTLQREVNPLPAGRYWLDVFEQPEGQTADFLEFAQGGLVSVESSEEFAADGTTPKRTFFIFRVKAPGAVFDAQRFGFPNIAPEGIKNSADTALVPDVDPLPAGSALKVALVVGAVVLVVGGVYYLATKKSAPSVVLMQAPAPG
jgi:hypothetical protein